MFDEIKRKICQQNYDFDQDYKFKKQKFIIEYDHNIIQFFEMFGMFIRFIYHHHNFVCLFEMSKTPKQHDGGIHFGFMIRSLINQISS